MVERKITPFLICAPVSQSSANRHISGPSDRLSCLSNRIPLI